uniref:Uncharacterized protein n=1 Tax=Romanomermis culicivorax TaxID=13658 RepID=A0A915LE95_ROMCU
MIMGYISTLPYTKQFGRYGVNIFQATDGKTIKVVVQYGLHRRGDGYRSEDYKAFVIHTDPSTPKRRLYANDREMVQQLVSKACPGALEFNYKLNENLKIRPNFDLFDNNYFKLFLQKQDRKRWLSSESPIVVIARRDADGVDYDHDGSVPNKIDKARNFYQNICLDN